MIETMRVVCQDGAVTGARHCGDGDRTLVFVHGVGSTAAIWDEQLREFGDEYRCFAVELRGNGTFEDPDPSSITRAGFADDVLAVTAAANAIPNNHSVRYRIDCRSMWASITPGW